MLDICMSLFMHASTTRFLHPRRPHVRWISLSFDTIGFVKGVLASADNSRTKRFSKIAEIANINSQQTPLRALNLKHDFTCEVVQVKLKLFVIL